MLCLLVNIVPIFETSSHPADQQGQKEHASCRKSSKFVLAFVLIIRSSLNFVTHFTHAVTAVCLNLGTFRNKARVRLWQATVPSTAERGGLCSHSSRAACVWNYRVYCLF
jgi:hypothetical protein